MTTCYEFKNIGEFIYKQALNRPLKVALEFDDGKCIHSIDYVTLYKKAACLAQELLKSAKKGDRALLVYPPSLDFIIAFIACNLAGLISVTCFPPANKAFSTKLTYIIKDCAPALVLTKKSVYWKLMAGSVLSKFKPYLSFADNFLPNVDDEVFIHLKLIRMLTTDSLEISKNMPDLSAFPSIEWDDLSFLQYTSGSTSASKGVMVSHGNVLTNLEVITRACKTSEDDVFVSWLPHNHDMGLLTAIMQPLYSGYTVRQMSPQEMIKSPLKWIKTISDCRATYSGGPTFAYGLSLKIDDSELEGLDLSNWRIVFCGAEPIRMDIISKFYEKMGKIGLKEDTFWTCYGLAESTVYVSSQHIVNRDEVLNLDKSKLFTEGIAETAEISGAGIQIASCGKGPEDQEIQIVDPSTLEPLPERQVGKILLRSGSIAKGYWNRPELTKEIFHTKATNGKEYLDTGDQGFLMNGELYITGRFKEILIIHGVNYTPYPIEASVEVLSEKIRPGSVAAIQINGEDFETITIVVEVKTENKNELIELAEMIQEIVLRGFTLDVRKIFFVQPRFIPKTTSGKMARFKIQEDLRCKPGIIFVYEGSKRKNSSHSEKTVYENVYNDLSSLAQRLNGRGFKKSDPLMDVFEDSLKQMQMLTQLELTLNCPDLPYSLISKSNTMDDLIKHSIAFCESHSIPDKTSSQDIQEAPLVPPMTQFISQSIGKEEFNLGYVCDIQGNLTYEEIHNALTKLINLQPYLRSSYSFDNNKFTLETAQNLTNAALDRKVAAFSERKAKTFLEECIHDLSEKIDPSKAPLFKALYIENTSTGKNYLVLVISHFIADPYSLWLWFKQLETLIYGTDEQIEALRNQSASEFKSLRDVYQPNMMSSSGVKYNIPVRNEVEEEIALCHFGEAAYARIVKLCKEESISLDSFIMGFSALAVQKCGRRSELLQYIHNGRTLLDPTHPIGNLIGWLNLAWPVSTPVWEGDYFNYLHKMNDKADDAKTHALEYNRKAWFPSSGQPEVQISPFEAEIEYSYTGIQNFQTSRGHFRTCLHFVNDYLHGNTFAKMLPRYRKMFIRPAYDKKLDILFFASVGWIDLKLLVQEFKKEIENCVELYESSKIR